MMLNLKFVGMVVAALLLVGAYWLGSYISAAQTGTPTSDPMARMATAMERMATAMEQMGGMHSGSTMGGMMSGMMGGTGMMGQSEAMASMMQNMQGMMEQMMQNCPHMKDMSGSTMGPHSEEKKP